MSNDKDSCGCDESKQLQKELDELKNAVCDYFERYATVKDSDLYRFYLLMDKPNRTLIRATAALKNELMRSHMGEDVSYEEMAAAVLKAARED
jgi:hypothetical protein